MIQKIFFISTFLLMLTIGPAFSQDTAEDKNDKTPQPLSADKSLQPPSADYVFPTAKKRFKQYLNNTVGPGAFLGAGIGASIQQINNTPPEWEKNGAGYLRRFSSNLGENAVETTTRYALSEALGQDPTYRKCECEGISKRAVHALKSGFTAKNRSGKTVFSAPKVVAPFAGSITAAEVWYPERYTVQDGIRRGGYGLAFNVGFNLIREFVFRK